MHILFAGGGTAGHINPALAIAGYVKEMEPDTKISYIGAPNNLEARLVPAKGYDFYTIEVSGFQRKLTPKNIIRNVVAVKKVISASARSRKLLKQLKPDVVVGTGGYVSGPVLREAAKLGIKTAIHEQNAFPGITTKALAPNVDRVMLAMEDAKKHIKLKNEPFYVGNPVRPELTELTKEQARKKMGLDNRRLDSPLRISFSRFTTIQEIDALILGIAEAKKVIRAAK